MTRLGRSMHGLAEGATIKHVACQSCQSEYVYHMQRTGFGSSYSFLFLDSAGAQSRATSSAVKAMNTKLILDCDAVPCPKCGWYQRNMVAKLRKEHALWMKWTSILSFVLAVCMAFAFMNNEGAIRPDQAFRFESVSVIVVLVLVGISLPLLRSRRAKKYDPNATPQAERIALGQAKGMLHSQFEQAAEQAVQEANQELAVAGNEPEPVAVVTDGAFNRRDLTQEPTKSKGNNWANYAFAAIAILVVLGKIASKWNRANRNNNQLPPPVAPAFRP